jgi:hypothetical protein
MTGETLLLRQIHPSFVQHGRVTSQAFRPTPKDENQLSVDNGDLVSPEGSWKRFSAQPNCTSAGVMAVSSGECAKCSVQIVEDGDPYPEHCHLDFAPFTRKEAEKIGKKLSNHAHQRGWLYEAT